MKQQSEDRVVPYPKARRFMEEAIRSTHNKPMMHGLLEVDVTKAAAHPARVEEALGDRDPLGGGDGWQGRRMGIPPSSPSICWVTVGGIGEKRDEVEGRRRRASA
jgi:hypothetical protein